MNYTLEDIVNHLHSEGIKGAQSVITDYDWDEDSVRASDAARVTIWLKREATNDDN